MGAFQPIPLDPLPQVQGPSAQDVQANPQAARTAQGGGNQGYPEQAGWAGKGGQSMNIVSNFLSGWMAGKYMAEQRKQKAAVDEVGHYQTDYQNAMTIYQNTVNNPDATKEQKEAARQTVLKNWHELHAVQKKYLIAGSGADAPKKTGAKAKVKNALGAPDPQMFASGAIDLADKMDPTQAVAPDLKQQEASFKFGQEKKDAAKREEYSTLLKKTNRTPEEDQRLEGIENELYGPGTSDQAKLSKLQVQKVEQQESDLKAARKKYETGGIGALNDREKTILQNAGEISKTTDIKTPFEAYMAEVGPGKKFATAAQAADAYFKKEMDLTKAARNPTMVEEAYGAGRAVLKDQYAQDDANPKAVHTYRITIGGKTETRQLTGEQMAAAQQQDKNIKSTQVPRQVTEGDVKSWAWEHIRPSPEEKEGAKPGKPEKPLTKAQANTVLSPVLASVVQDHPEWNRFVARGGTQGGGISMYLKPYESGEGSILPWKDSEKDIRKQWEDFKKEVENEMIRRGQGQLIPQLMPDDGTPVAENYKPQQMTPTPA